MKAVECGNLHDWDNQITVPKPAKTHSRTTWLPTPTSVAIYFNDFTSKNIDEIDSAGNNLSMG